MGAYSAAEESVWRREGWSRGTIVHIWQNAAELGAVESSSFTVERDIFALKCSFVRSALYGNDLGGVLGLILSGTAIVGS
jgi:hypothetical protein